MRTRLVIRTIIFITVVTTLTVASRTLRANTGTCSGAPVTLPFTDVLGNTFFCQIAGAYFSGLTNGTSATTYSPTDKVTREQMAAFVTRAMDQSVRRGSERAALDQFWTNQGDSALALTTVGDSPKAVASDGTDLWVANYSSGTVSRIRASDGAKLGADWTGAVHASAVLVAMGHVFVTGDFFGSPGKLYGIDPAQPPGTVTTLSSNLGESPVAMAFDGQRIWTANFGTGVTGSGSVTVVALNPLDVTTITTGFNGCQGILWDGATIWVTDYASHQLMKLDSNGDVLMSVSVLSGAQFPVFDGTNIWVPNHNAGSVSVVRATGGASGTVVATLTGNGLSNPNQAAFDGERIMVTNGTDRVSVWKASDLTPIGSYSTGANTLPGGVCSDGLNFWFTLYGPGKLARF